MSLDDAIEHAKTVSQNLSICQKCRSEHAQLAEWLTELKSLKYTSGESEETSNG